MSILRVAPAIVAFALLLSLGASVGTASVGTAPEQASADVTRRALVIGLDAYEQVRPLTRAVADARAVGGRLERIGFEVTLLEDLDRQAMNAGVSAFLSGIETGDSVVFFYAGHAVEIDGLNYLLATDIAPRGVEAEDFVRREGFLLDDLFADLRESGARLNVSIIDACRDNPFAAPETRGVNVSGGLARVAPPEGSFVIFSAGAGQVALDRLPGEDPDPNSVFTRVFLDLVDEPGLDLRDMAVELRRRVADIAAGIGWRQTPAYYDEMLGEFAFVPAGARGVSEGEAVASDDPAPTQPEGVDPVEADYAFARNLDTKDAWRVFLERHGQTSGALVETARARLAALDAPNRAISPVAPAAAPDEAEAALGLDETRRRAVQVRLGMLGFSTQGVDGVFGPRTRAAILGWQVSTGRAATGYLTAADMEALFARRASEPRPAAPDEPLAAPQNPPPTASQIAPPTGQGQRQAAEAPARRQPDGVFGGGYIDENGCARRADGTLVMC